MTYIVLCYEQVSGLACLETGFLSSPYPQGRINEHVGSTLEVCLAAMTIWKSFIDRYHPRMTCLLGLGAATTQTPADLLLMSLLD